LNILPLFNEDAIRSNICGILVFTLAFYTIIIFKKYNIINNVNKWIILFLVKLLIAYILFIIFTYIPLTPEQYRADGYYSDQTLYDHHAYNLVINNWVTYSYDLFYTWLSFGVVLYGAIIYTIFGTNLINIITVNCLMALFTSLIICYIYNLITNKKTDYFKLVMFLPFSTSYDSSLNKDTLTNTLFYINILIIIYINITKSKILSKATTLFVISFLLLLCVRANVGAIVLIIMFFIQLLKKSFKYYLIVLIAIIFLSLIFIVYPNSFDLFLKMIDPETFYAEQKQFLVRVSAEGASDLKIYLASLTMPANNTNLIIGIPLRCIIWLYNPYPDILPHLFDKNYIINMLHDDAYKFASYSYVLGSSFSTWIIIFITPQLLYILFYGYKLIKQWYLLIISFVIPLIIISNLTFVAGKRYRILMEPFLILFYYLAKTNTKKINCLSYIYTILLAIPAILYYIYTIR
jgi:hypothetical protein